MKTEFIELSKTRRNLVVEVSSTVVSNEIDRLTQSYGRAARIPGFRPGKVPSKLVKQRFRDQILRDVARGLIPSAVAEALRERKLEPVDTPDIRDVVVEEGQPLKFSAFFETVPPIDPGDYKSITLRRPPVKVESPDMERALMQLRDRAAHDEPVENRAVEFGDTVIVDIERRAVNRPVGLPSNKNSKTDKIQPDRREGVSIEIGADANPPGFDKQLMGSTKGTSKDFTITYPVEYTDKTLAGTEVHYDITLKDIRRRVLPDLDDEFAKDVSDFESLEALREQIEKDLLQQAEHEADRQVRADLMKQLAARVTLEVPEVLVNREIDRRLEEFSSRLMVQQIDPQQVKIDWPALREKQRDASSEAVRGTLVLDEVARREALEVTDEDLQNELRQYAERTGRTESAVRAQLEKSGNLSRLLSGLRREKTIDLLLERATVLNL